MRFTLVVLSSALVTTAAAAQTPTEIGFSGARWEIAGANTVVERYHGREALRIRTGRATRRDARLEDGTIEFDMEVTPHRAFVYLRFRMESDTEYEDLYFRSHKSELPDAVQYTPVFQGASNWQLYHMEGYTAAAPLPPGAWIHVRVVLSGPWAAVFVGDTEEPQMVTRLARDPAPGYIALRGFAPAGGSPDDTYVATFANVVVRPGEVAYDFSNASAGNLAPAGTIASWSASRPFDAEPGTIETLPQGVLNGGGWTDVPTDHTGLAVFGRYIRLPNRMRRPAALARVRISAESAATRRFNFGYSDDVSVFLNGRLIFAADDSYLFNFPRRQGLIGLHQATLYLPLEPGENELILAISDVFGGWGVMGQIPDRAGISVR